MSAKDETGNRYGRLTVLTRAGTSKNRTATWHCRCDCGRSLVVDGSSLRSGHTRSCGCIRRGAIERDDTVSCPGCNEQLSVVKVSAAGTRGSAWCSSCGIAVRATREQGRWVGLNRR